jgi:hypothetical protein
MRVGPKKALRAGYAFPVWKKRLLKPRFTPKTVGSDRAAVKSELPGKVFQPEFAPTCPCGSPHELNRAFCSSVSEP